MTDFASIGIEMDSRPVVEGTKALDALGESAARVEQKVRVSNGQMSDTAKIMQAQAAQAKAAADANAVLGNSTNQLTLGQQHFIDTLKDQAATVGMSRTQLLEYRAAELGVTEQTKDLIEQIKKASEAQNNHGISLSSNRSKIELVRIANDALTGQYGRMESAVMVLGNATGATSMIFGGMGITIAALIAPLATYAIAAEQAAAETRAMNAAIGLSGNYAGQTVDSISELATRIGAAGQITTGAAKQMVTSFVASGQIGGQALEKIAGLAGNYAQATGESVDKITPKLIQLFSNPKVGAEELKNTMHLLTAENVDYIGSLDDSGQRQQAQAVLADALAGRLALQAKQVGGLTGLWRDFAGAMSDFWEVVKQHAGGATPYQEALNAARAQLDELQSTPNVFGGDKELDDKIAKQKKLIADMIAAHQAEEAASQAAATKASEDADKRNAVYAELHKGQLQRIEDLKDERKILDGEANTPEVAQRRLEIDKQIQSIQRAMGAEGRQLTQQQLTDGDQYNLLVLKGQEERLQAQLKLGVISQQQFDQLLTQNALDQNAEKQSYELAMSHVAGLTKAERDAHQDKLKYLREEADQIHDKGVATISIDQKKIDDDSANAINKYTSDLQKQLDAIEAATGRREKSKSAIEGETAALYAQAVANMKLQVSAPITDEHTKADRDAAARMLVDLEKELDLHQKIAKALQIQEEYSYSKKAADQAIQDWQRAGASIADSLSKGFGAGGDAIGKMFKAYSEGMAGQLRAQKDLAEARDKMPKDSPEQIAAISRAQQEGVAAQLKSYGDLATAAQGFFDKGSSGYEAMHKISQVYYLAETAMALASLPAKLAAGAATMFAQSGFGGFAGVAAMAAVVAGFGVAVSGGSHADVSQQRQAQNGTGTALGDPTAKTDSIAKSLSMIESNTYDGLSVSQGMLSSLQSIETNITSFTGLLMQTAGFSTTVSGMNLNTNNGLATTIGSAGLTAGGAMVGGAAGAGLTAFTAAGAIGGPIGMAIGAALGYALSKIPVIGNLMTSIFGGKQTLNDTGFTMDAATYGQIASSGANAKTYADITTSGGWFSSDKHSTQTTNLTAEADQQIAKVITGIGDTIKTAASLLGVNCDAFDEKLNGFVVSIGDISLKGLSTADQQAAIQAAFSKLGDQMTEAAFSTITQFSRAGEGALQTLTRVATDYQTVDAVFKSYGTAFSQVGLESIGAREELINLAGGLDKFTSQADYFVKNLMTQGQQTTALRNAIQPTLDKYGLSTIGADAVSNFSKLVIEFGAMGSAGAQAYTELMNIAPAFKQVTDVAKGLQDQIDQLTLSAEQQDALQRSKLDPQNQLLFDQYTHAKLVNQAKADLVTAYDNEVQSIQSTIDRLKQFGQSMHDFVNSLQLGSMSPLNPADKYAAALSQYNETLAKAQAGDVTAQGQLQSVSQAFLQASKDANASNSTYQSDYRRVISMSDQMATWAGNQVTDTQASLNVLHEQVSKLVDIDKGVMTVADAINNLSLILAKGADGSGATSPGATSADVTAITQLYKELFNGRAPDQAGLDFWVSKLQSGVTLPQIISAMQHSPEYAAEVAQGKVPSLGTSTSTSLGSTLDPTTGSTIPTATADASAQITQLYWNLLGHAPDPNGLAWWDQQAQNGVSISAISDAIKQSSEYADVHASSTPANIIQPDAPATTTSSTSSNSSYSDLVASHAALLSQVTILNAQISSLRTEAQSQSDNQVDATMNAGADTGDQVASAIATSTQAAAWNASNTVALR